MSDRLSPEMERRIHALCRRISIAHDLDDEVREELYTHMEDKLLGYLNGEERITGEDALVLVRKQYRDPAAVRKIAREMHAWKPRTGIGREIGAAAGATLGAVLVSEGITRALFGIFLALAIPRIDLTGALLVTHLGLPPLLLWGTLLVWRRKMENGRALWFRNWGARRFTMLLVSLGCAALLLVSLSWPDQYALLMHRERIPFGLAIPSVLMSLAWLWWLRPGSALFPTAIPGAFSTKNPRTWNP